MSRLVNFGLGEVCDRVSILALKILHGEMKGADIAHFRNERNVLIAQMQKREGGRWLELYADLAAVNAALWYAEDALRVLRKCELSAATEHIVETAFRIQTLNDQRANIVQVINDLVGDKVQEKV